MTLAGNDVRGEDSCAMEKSTKQNVICSRHRNKNSYFKVSKSAVKEKSAVSVKLGSDY